LVFLTGLLVNIHEFETVNFNNKKLVNKLAYKDGKFLHTPIAYYCNSTATFQLRLLVAGDINPNPGPTNAVITSKSNSNHLLHVEESSMPQQCNQPPKYCRNQLLNLNSRKYELSQTTWNNIKLLGIDAKRRGTRSGTRKLKHKPKQYDHDISTCTTDSQNSKLMDVRLWNAQSVRYKCTALSDYVMEYDIDIMAITETWLKESDNVIIGELTPPGYSFINVPRPCNELDTKVNHGGIGLLFKSLLQFSMLSSEPYMYTTFEHARFCDKKKDIVYIIVYRPPPSTENGFLTTQFLNEFDSFLGSLNLSTRKTIILGDFNIHVDLLSKPEVSKFYHQ
jgi:hypothetical protein